MSHVTNSSSTQYALFENAPLPLSLHKPSPAQSSIFPLLLETESYPGAQGWELTMEARLAYNSQAILLPQPPKCWGYCPVLHAQYGPSLLQGPPSLFLSTILLFLNQQEIKFLPMIIKNVCCVVGEWRGVCVWNAMRLGGMV